MLVEGLDGGGDLIAFSFVMGQGFGKCLLPKDVKTVIHRLILFDDVRVIDDGRDGCVHKAKTSKHGHEFMLVSAGFSNPNRIY